MIKVEQLTREETIALGAEAEVYLGNYYGKKVVAKHRKSKKYRVEQIDTLLRKNRTLQEVRLLINANKMGINVPLVLDVDKSTWTIVMEYVGGTPLKYLMEDKDITGYFFTAGMYLGKLHKNNFVHGDLTTSNMLLKDESLYFIDFGLGYGTTQIEDFAVDILVLKHTLDSSHSRQSQVAYDAFFEGYKKSNPRANEVMKRIEIVQSRIRYH